MAGLNKVTVDDINVKGKKVLVRVDFNVPLKDGVITNDNRITAALPTIKKLVADGGKVVLCSHLGKPKNGPEAKFSLAPAAARLAELLPETKVTFAADDTVVGDNAKRQLLKWLTVISLFLRTQDSEAQRKQRTAKLSLRNLLTSLTTKYS